MSPNRGSDVGMLTELDGEAYYRIENVDDLPPFLMSIASDADLWMFVTSRGGLTAGRIGAAGALFPYETEDKLYDGHFHTGPRTIIRVAGAAGRDSVWEPLGACAGPVDFPRNLYKNVLGNRVVHEEVASAIGLRFRSRWAACDEFGWVRTCTLINEGDSPVSLSILDGLRNILPWGAALSIYQTSSSLVDAYKRVDRDPHTGMGIYSLSSKIVDRPEAAEELRANVVWCAGLDGGATAFSGDTPDVFLRGGSVSGDDILTGRRGNYFRTADLNLQPGSSATWHMGCDAGLDHAAIASLRGMIEDHRIVSRITEALERAGDNLERNVASADGLQMTAAPITDGHHFANTLFNNMRGGIFAGGYAIDPLDFASFLASRNSRVARRLQSVCERLGEGLDVASLLEIAEESKDADFIRLAHEYLPLYYGRRHGDPSRPWNRFSIRLKNADGSRALRYEGNWRDIFQNWEALSLSFPDYLPHMIAKFVNASTVDGFNPYRLTREGIDWEVNDPEDPWSYIGYWGDHQIIYLLKFLEALPRYAPGELEKLLEQEIFSYADVPYRIKPYDDIVADPHDTIVFDDDLAAAVEERVASIGADGKLVLSRDGSVYHVNLFEKLLV
ncbi:MAG: hypothetical protein HKN20_15880, partial [Gemmatimonadetes bacterium]|nr:hypothetical protein [Gemmatimonadota bacterium]